MVQSVRTSVEDVRARATPPDRRTSVDPVRDAADKVSVAAVGAEAQGLAADVSTFRRDRNVILAQSGEPRPGPDRTEGPQAVDPDAGVRTTPQDPFDFSRSGPQLDAVERSWVGVDGQPGTRDQTLRLLSDHGVTFPADSRRSPVVAAPGLREARNAVLGFDPGSGRTLVDTAFLERAYGADLDRTERAEIAQRLGHEAIHKYDLDTGRMTIPADGRPNATFLRQSTESEIRAHAWMLRTGEEMGVGADFRDNTVRALRGYRERELTIGLAEELGRADELVGLSSADMGRWLSTNIGARPGYSDRLAAIRSADPMALANESWRLFGYR